MTNFVIVNDGQMQWIADQRELRSALESLGWSRDGSRWTEPEGYDPSACDAEAPYTILCDHCSDRSDEITEKEREDMPSFTWRPDWNCWQFA